jgi:O-antigen/teichoic acid export membrane protein
MKGAVARLMGSTVVSQAVLSASNFFVASYLLRHIGAEPYGFYVLVTTAILLFASLQGSFFLTPTINILPASDLRERQLYIGGLIRLRFRVTIGLSLFIAMATVLAWLTNLAEVDHVGLVLAGVIAGSASMYREFVRSLLLFHHQGGLVLRGDLIYSGLLIAGSVGGALLPSPAAMTVLGLGLAALVSSALFTYRLWEFEPWVRTDPPAVMQRIASTGGWSAFGAMIHWSFGQGYTYLVAALLDVKAVAALAATRLLLMPLNLLSSGVSQSMYTLVSRWFVADGLSGTLRRVAKITLALLALGMVYVVVAWLARDLFFDVVLKRVFNDQDRLIALWSLLFLMMLIRDQLNCVLVVLSKLKLLSYITMASAVTALVIMTIALPRIGPPGALFGIIAGEMVNMLGMGLLLMFGRSRQPKPAAG